jgi:1-acyl-sn-glycerol-3-phosphate acyltransferase
MNLLRGLLSSLLLVLNTVIACIPLFIAGAVRPLLPEAGRRRLRRRMDGLIDFWVGNNRRIFRALGLTRLQVQWQEPEEGSATPQATLSREHWYLVVSNHQSWTDIVIIQNVLWGHIPPVKFFTKRQLIWVPLLGPAMWLLDFPYVRRMSREQIAADPELAELDREATRRACRRFRDHPTTVLNFLEGTRFTPAKHAAQEARFEHLLNPKIGGLTYVIDELGDKLDRLLDLTIVYRGEVPTFWQLMQGRCPAVDVLVESRPLPPALRAPAGAETRREQIGPWIEKLWTDKDRRLHDLRVEQLPPQRQPAG